MISISITADMKDATAFLVRVTGQLSHPRELNDALGRRLERELKAHFLSRNAGPNKMGAAKTNFWSGVRAATVLTEVTDTGATVSIGADSHFRIHYLGGVVKPTGGRKFLTIPLIKEARGIRAAAYEKTTGHKLFRLPGRNVLVERSESGDRSLLSGSTASVRTKTGFRKISVRGRSQIRPVYALATQVRIPKDPDALPPSKTLAAALQATANAWAEKL